MAYCKHTVKELNEYVGEKVDNYCPLCAIERRNALIKELELDVKMQKETTISLKEEIKDLEEEVDSLEEELVDIRGCEPERDDSRD